MSRLRTPTNRARRAAVATLAVLAVATLVAGGCGVHENGGVIERLPTTTAAPMPQTGS